MAKIDTNKTTSGAEAPAGKATRERIADNPVMALGAGFAVGAVLGALLPSGQRERKALKPLATKVSGAARGAVDSGKEKFGRLSDEVVTQVRSTVDTVVAKAKEETGA